jgi:hypothetical protein
MIVANTSAQSNTISNSKTLTSNLETKSLSILYTNKFYKKSIENPLGEKVESKLLTTAKSAEEYDLMAKKEFGSYVNPFTNHLKIVPKDQVEYTKVQIIKKGTGLTIAKQDLKNGNNVLDMSNIESGVYILIMTNAERNIHSEEITIL